MKLKKKKKKTNKNLLSLNYTMIRVVFIFFSKKLKYF